MVHNLVNKRLSKPDFDCVNIGDAYDCGTFMCALRVRHTLIDRLVVL